MTVEKTVIEHYRHGALEGALLIPLLRIKTWPSS